MEEQMDTDQIKGKLQNMFGKAEEAVGEAIGSQNLSNAGAEDRLKGAAVETWGNTKDAVHSTGTTAATRADVHGTHTSESLRDRVVSGTEHLKNSINAKVDGYKEHQAEKRDDLDRSI
ncbi:MAG: CsbD family protein [Janthinobacterium lividum]